MAKIRELQPAHKSDKVTVSQATRAFKKVRNASTGRVLADTRKQSAARNKPSGKTAAGVSRAKR